MAQKIDWFGLGAAFVDTYCQDNVAPAMAIRLGLVVKPTKRTWKPVQQTSE